jgi:hypothetical protein
MSTPDWRGFAGKDLSKCAKVEHVFESVLAEVAPREDAPCEEDWVDPAWLVESPPPERVPEPEELGQVPAAQCAPSGWLALELDHATVDPGRLSDADLIDTITGFERITSWAGARQAQLLAEFARRRCADYSPPDRSETPARIGGYAPDEVALALRWSRIAATGRLVMAQALARSLPGTLAAWQSGRLDARKAAAITETSYLLPPEQHGALEERVLPRAGAQTLAQLRAALARAVLALDPEGAAARHAQRRTERRVVLSAEEDGMASLWALLSAPDATAAYQRLGELARGLGAEDSRSMDARRADLLVDLLTGRRCATTAQLPTTVGTGRPGPASPETTSPETTSPDPTGPAEAARHSCVPRPPGKPQVSVIVPITMLLGLDEQPGELAGYGPIPAPLAREIAAQGTWRRLLTDPVSGVLLDHGRTTYAPPAGLADFVRARDLCCRHSGCRHRATTADLDHTIPYPEGATSEHNLHARCRHHHLVKTFGAGWRVEQHPDGTITVTTPTGHSYSSQPHDYRPDPHPPPASPVPGTTSGPEPPEDDEPPF